MAGLLDWLQTPAGLGLLSAAAGGMAGARKGQPWNTAGRGLASGLVGYNAAVDNERQLANTAIADKYRSMQMQEIEQKLADQQRQRAWRENLPGVMKKTVDVKAQHEFDNPFGQDEIGAGLQNVVGQAPDMQARQEYMMSPDSPYADKLVEQQLFPQKKEPIKVGDRLIDPETFQPVYEPPVQEDYNKPFLSDGRPNPAYQDYATKKASAGATRVDIGPTRVENITTQESEGSKVYGKGLGEMQVDIQKQGFTAPTRIANLNRMDQLLDGVDSGRFSGAGLEAARFAKSFGFNIDPKLGNKQAAEALAIEMALAMREPGSGPMTDKDFDNYLNTVPSLAKTAEGRKQITATLKAKAKRDIEISKMARAYAKQNRGVVDDNFLDQVAEYMAQNPVVRIDNAAANNGGWSMKKKGQ